VGFVLPCCPASGSPISELLAADADSSNRLKLLHPNWTTRQQVLYNKLTIHASGRVIVIYIFAAVATLILALGIESQSRTRKYPIAIGVTLWLGSVALGFIYFHLFTGFWFFSATLLMAAAWRLLLQLVFKRR
jgi:hypothetical protein